MAQTLHRILVHVVFSTKDRGPLLKEPIRPQLFAYLGGIVRSLGGEPLIVNGVADHVDLPPGTSPLSKLDLGPFEVHSMV